MDATRGRSVAVMTARRIAIVPHTHWDREWYKPFQTFRLELVDLVDDLLDLLEQDACYAHFLLDGQMAVVDDYLEIRPEAEERLRALAAAGRITVGPWYILMDEFLVSGETIVRNLQMGMVRGGRLRWGHGGRLPARHVRPHRPDAPDPPAGRLRTTPWSGAGCPSPGDHDAFLWEAPDGSAVRAEYLRRLRQRRRPARRRQGAGPPRPRPRGRSGRLHPRMTCCA